MRNHSRPIFIVVIFILLLGCVLSATACAAKTTFEAGSRTDFAYTNESVDLTLTLPDKWAFYDDTLIRMMMASSGQLVADKDSLAKSEAGSQYEFMAYSPAGDTISLVADTANSRVSLRRYINSYKQSMTAQIPDSVCTFGDDMPEIILGGESWTRLTVRSTLLGVTMTQYVWFCKLDDAILTLTAADLSGQDAAYYESLFTTAAS